MYFPYIRAKQFDLSAIVELNDSLFKRKSINPIIEPVTETIKKNQFKRLSEKNVPFLLVVNPIVGDLKSTIPQTTIISTLVQDTFQNYGNYWLAFIIQPGTTSSDVRNFIKAFPNHKHAYIHFHQFNDARELAKVIASDTNNEFNIFIDGRVSIDYTDAFLTSEAPDIIIRDGFKKRTKNELYPDEDFFFELHKVYGSQMNYDGFGDFTIIGSQFEKGGGPAYVVALHITEKDRSKNLIVKHFKSDAEVPPSAVNPGGKFKKALARLKKYVDNAGLKSQGIDGYMELHSTGHFPGLGIAKKLSIMHHIELVSTFLST